MLILNDFLPSLFPGMSFDIDSHTFFFRQGHLDVDLNEVGRQQAETVSGATVMCTL